MTRYSLRFVLCVLLAGGLMAARADKVDDLIQAQMKRRRIPGLALAVVRDGKVIKAKGYGLANVELSVPATKDTIYELASVTKQFTATAIMLLIADGKLALEDKVSQHLSDLPKAWENVTVRQLLNHTSGIKSYTSLPNFFATARKDYTQKELIQLVTEAPLEFPSGDKWNYNNTGYFLLGMLIEKVSGKSYEAFLKERIFTPLGMTVTRLNNFRDIIPNRAMGYSAEGNSLRNGEYVSPTQPFAAGALVSSVSDMAKWDAALYTEKILKKSDLQMMWTPTKLKEGKTQDYGFGWQVGDYGGHKYVGHGGGIQGFSTFILRLLDDKLTVIILSNYDRMDTGGLARSVAALTIPAVAPVPPKPIEDKDPALTQRLKGVLLDAAQGKADPALFTAEAQKLLIPRIQGGKALFAGFGAFKSFTLIEQKEEGKTRTYRYRAEFANETLSVAYVLDADGKIAGIGLRPE